MSRRLLLTALTLFAALSLSAQRHRGHSLTITTNDDAPGFDCQSHLMMHAYDLDATVRGEEVRTAAAGQPLTVSGSRNGGIIVRGWNQPNYEIRLCKVAAARNDAEARSTLDQIKLTTQDGGLSASGPDSNDDQVWTTLFLIQAPQNGSVKLSTYNGGVSVKSFNGKADINTHNGGIDLKESGGAINAEALNGGIEIRDCSGDVHVTTHNGGIDLKLGTNWAGAGLVASSHNGGLSIRLPERFDSTLLAETSGNSNIRCRLAGCDSAQRTWDDRVRRIQLGSGSPQVKVSSVNGGISIGLRSGTSKDDDDNDDDD